MHFENATGIKYNKTKCMGIGLGSNKGSQRKPLGFKWNSDKIRKKDPRGYTEVGTFTTITHRKENINKPGHAK